MNQVDISNYKLVNEISNKKNQIVIFFIAVVVAILGLSYLLKIVLSYWPMVLIIFIIFFYHIYRPRICPFCEKRMQRDFSYGPILDFIIALMIKSK
jgi:hypothetical protein